MAKKITDRQRLNWIQRECDYIKLDGTFLWLVPTNGYALVRNAIDAAIRAARGKR